MKNVLAYVVIMVFLSSSNLALALPTKTLIVGIDDSPPYSFINQTGEAEGKIVNLLNALASAADVHLRYVFCPWARCIRLVQSGQINLLAGLSKSPERAALLHFIKPAIFTQEATFNFYTRHSQTEIHTYADLSDLVIGKLRGSQHFTQFDNDVSLTTVDAQDVKTLFLLLQSGRIDAFIHLSETFAPYQEQFDPNQTIQTADFAQKVEARGYLVLSKLSTTIETLEQLNQAMIKLSQDGKIEQLLQE